MQNSDRYDVLSTQHDEAAIQGRMNRFNTDIAINQFSAVAYVIWIGSSFMHAGYNNNEANKSKLLG